MFGFVVSVVGTLVLLAGWGIIVYAMWRNQRAAGDSPQVDKTNFGPRGAAIIETTLHPDHAAMWLRFCPADEAELVLVDPRTGGNRYIRRVFPAIGQDSSEQYGIRGDDGRAT